MKALITRLDGYTDPKVSQLARDVQTGFGRVPDTCICYVTATWQEPFVLTVPSVNPNETVRSAPPAEIRCGRARNLSDSSERVAPGGTSWEWMGNGRARIDAAHGLTPGIKYELEFTVIG